MLYIPDIGLPPETEQFLDALQARIDGHDDRPQRISIAKTLFDLRHRAGFRRSFSIVQDTLASMSPPYRRCYYCEDSEHRDIEHIKPKRHYPDLCFRWVNYAYACSICNGAKSDKVGIFTNNNDEVTIFNRNYPMDQELPDGEAAFIDPRTENPLDYLKLDLQTGLIGPLHTVGRAHARAKYTIDVLKINRDAIRRNRASMIESYLKYLEAYRISIETDDGRGARILQEITRLPQPTVFAEIRRQKDDYPHIKMLIDLVPNP